MRFGVVIEVPSPDDKSNLALTMDLYADEDGRMDAPAKHIVDLRLRTPVFSLGEILILDSDGRELNGRGRKPSRWGVTVEYFDNIEEAVTKAQELQS